jgi:hypothetical protein
MGRQRVPELTTQLQDAAAALPRERDASVAELLRLEVSTVVRDAMTGEPMPSVPHALLDIAGNFTRELQNLAIVPYDSSLDRPSLTISPDTFEHLANVAKAALQASRFPQDTQETLNRIEKYSAFLRDFLRRVPADQGSDFIGKSRETLATLVDAGSALSVSVDDSISLHKMWCLGLERVKAKSLVYARDGMLISQHDDPIPEPDSVAASVHHQSVDAAARSSGSIAEGLDRLLSARVGLIVSEGRGSVRKWLPGVTSDVLVLRGAWDSVRGGWRGALREANILIASRCAIVDTSGQTANGKHVVLRTRIWIDGDFQTDVLWSAEIASPIIDAHFRAVWAVAGSLLVQAALKRLVTLGVVWSGTLLCVVMPMYRIIAVGFIQEAQAVILDRRIWAGLAFVVSGLTTHWALTLRTRRMFRSGRFK